MFSGCKECPKIPDKTAFVEKKCPKFTSKIKIKIDDLNSTHGAISWRDVSKIEYFLMAKKNFNSTVDSINSK
jgi:hypothetical protein